MSIYRFQDRHIGPSADEVTAMLKTIGVDSLDHLIEQTVPDSIRLKTPLDIGPALSEADALAHIKSVADQNRVLTSLIGQGYYGTLLPKVIQRNILENPAWYTAYTPYQPEISQGRLEALLNFQTMITDLTGLDVANASLLDEATAAAEAMAMANRVASAKGDTFFVDENCHPQTIAVVKTRAEAMGWNVVVGNPFAPIEQNGLFGAVLQYPGTNGIVSDFRPVIENLHQRGAIAVMAMDLLAATLLVPAGEMGADICVGSTQRFGVPMGYGGPHAAYIATKDAFKRSMPGRLVGVSVDSRGKPAYRLTLQTREQHIRREKATSNICTAQVLLAIISAMYAVYHGPEGLTAIAQQVHDHTARLAASLQKLGFKLRNQSFFDTLTVETGARSDDIMAKALGLGINLRRFDQTAIAVSLDETVGEAIVGKVLQAFGGTAVADEQAQGLPDTLRRHSPFLTHPIFHQFRSETEMLRYIRRLGDLDLALDRAMIPLGSCTMKLNATTEMIPVTWPEFADLHPYAPLDQAQGYRAMVADLEAKLCAITGYDAFSFQPNSGAQGEYAGLLAIRAYHRSRGDGHRTICLIPSSAHGTNPATAHLAGMKVVVVACDKQGNVDFDDLSAKAREHAHDLAAVMITYPSTHGVFEEHIRDICAVVHECGGQVYLDGANLNAQVGLSRPGDYGADVGHLNLHKTFCIPHGGGGPGMGPIGLRQHLVPFVPGQPHLPDQQVGPVSAAPLGSAGILVISWAYILMMGGDGLTAATKAAILNANYIAARLDRFYPLLYRSPNGRVAHECIVDPRTFGAAANVTVEDIAKRLIDFGFHAPTVSFPVAGTLMIEPTESESQAELDRFCDALIHIRQEIDQIAAGRMDKVNNPIKNAPHTVFDLADEVWDRPYTRIEGCFPAGTERQDKYWSPVNRIDNVHGDRVPICTLCS